MDANDETCDEQLPLPPRPVPGCPYSGIVSLLKAAVAQPRLRRLYPFTSHFTLAFSSSTGYPWTMQAGSIEPGERIPES
ncbi:DUF6193 family natural product biosynthesis protein [Streptomyces adustus]|uniref:DUF6193 family natural product biosynthesis protein n=1 Tax=Streptomyces adustus TaxID=1609272 RepID=UPI003724A586